MKKTVVTILAIALVIGVIFAIVLFIKDQEIKSQIDAIEQSEFVDSEGENGEGESNLSDKEAVSEITLARADGEWSVSETGEYTIDPASVNFEFTGYKVGGQHIGTFDDLQADISLDENGDPTSLSIVFDMTSVQTDTEAVTKHLQTDDFFMAETYPTITAIVKDVQLESATSAKVVTDVTIKNITKTLSIPVTLTRTDGRVEFAIDTTMKISEFDISFGPVKDEIRIQASGAFVKK